MPPQAGRLGGTIVPIDSMKSRSLAVASAGGRPRREVCPGPPSPFGFRLCSWQEPVGSELSTKQASRSSYVPEYGRSVPVSTRNCRSNT
jgi:hypothetical protein